MAAVALKAGDVSSDNGAASIRGHVSRHHVRKPLLCCQKTSASSGYKSQRKDRAKGRKKGRRKQGDSRKKKTGWEKRKEKRTEGKGDEEDADTPEKKNRENKERKQRDAHWVAQGEGSRGEGLLNLFQNRRIRDQAQTNWKRNTNTSSKEKQTKRKNQRKSKRNREDINPKHVAVFVLLPGNSSLAK